MSVVELRPYQEDVLERSEKAEARGVRKQLIVAATGTGKSVVFAEQIRRRGGRALVLAHRDELIAQAVAKLMDVDDNLVPTYAACAQLKSVERYDLAARWKPGQHRLLGVVKAEADDALADVVVASVQSLRPARLAALTDTRVPPFRTLVCDEAHHGTSPSYRAIFDALRAGEPDGPLLTGWTATPDRGDGKGLDQIFDEIVASYDMLTGIKEGYLSDLRGVEVMLADFDEKSMQVRRGDYTAGSAGRALEAANAPELIVQAWLREAPGLKTLVFTPTVATAVATCDEFRKAGARAEWVSGETPHEQRKQLWRDFRSGRVQVVTNCAVATEGFDEPSIACIVMARPTKSRALYAQMCGRGSRRFPTKSVCIVLDVVGNAARHNLVTLPSLFGVESNPRARDGTRTITEAVAEAEQAKGRLGESQKATLFKPLPKTQIAWVVATVDGVQTYARPLGKKMVNGKAEPQPTVLLSPTEGGSWRVALVFPKGNVRVLMDGTTLELCQGIGEDYVRKHTPVQAFTDKNAAWRQKPASEAQIVFAENLGIAVVDGWTSGQIGAAIDAELAARALRKAARVARR